MHCPLSEEFQSDSSKQSKAFVINWVKYSSSGLHPASDTCKRISTDNPFLHGIPSVASRDNPVKSFSQGIQEKG